METKRAIRKQILERRNGLDDTQRQQASGQIADTLYAAEEYQRAEIILTYVNYGSEVDTLAIINKSLAQGKKVYCPRVLAPGHIEFYRIRALDELQKGYQGIPEPTGEDCFCYQEQSNKDSVLMLMPLTVFDNDRNRIGYGGGFYDRYLSTAEGIFTIGLAFDCQRWREILPTEAHDIRVKKIITETGIY